MTATFLLRAGRIDRSDLCNVMLHRGIVIANWGLRRDVPSAICKNWYLRTRVSYFSDQLARVYITLYQWHSGLFLFTVILFFASSRFEMKRDQKTSWSHMAEFFRRLSEARSLAQVSIWSAKREGTRNIDSIRDACIFLNQYSFSGKYVSCPNQLKELRNDDRQLLGSSFSPR